MLPSVPTTQPAEEGQPSSKRVKMAHDVEVGEAELEPENTEAEKDVDESVFSEAEQVKVS